MNLPASCDAQGYFHFIDRIGDTFRWKDENVATAEVNGVIRDCPGVVDAVTYGVFVPGADGRAGMAAIVTDADFEFDVFADHLAVRLPPYAHPQFVRISNVLDTTETFKLKKQQLMGQGFDPDQIDEPLYFKDPEVRCISFARCRTLFRNRGWQDPLLAVHKGNSWWLPAKNRFNDLACEINI